jgi:hypothetical protein
LRRLTQHATGLLFSVGLLVSVPGYAQQTLGLFINDTPAEGLTLFSPIGATTTYLINNDGLVVNSWGSAYRPAMMGYLLDSGHLLRAARLTNVSPNFSGVAGSGGLLEEHDWDGSLVWEFEYSGTDYLSHHDIEPLPNGNVLLIAWDYMTATEAIAAGKNPSLVGTGLRIDHIIEVAPTPPIGGEIVWEWHTSDHLIQDFDPTKDNYGAVEDHPELVDFNFGDGRADWTHFNGIDYNAELDQIIVSVRALDEIWILDHSTTTEEAAGHSGGTQHKGGDLLYRWGNPQSYRRGTVDDRRLFGQHDAQWIPSGYPGAGNILMFNNGENRREGLYSTVDEITPPLEPDGSYTLVDGVAFGPVSLTWSFVGDPPHSLFSNNISGAERQPNGNTLICEGVRGSFIEVEADGTPVWRYVNPTSGTTVLEQGAPPGNNAVFKVRRYPSDFPGFAGRDLTPGDPVEQFTRPYPATAGSLRATRVQSDGAGIDVEWDAFSCPSFDYKLIYGELTGVATHTLTGAECAIGVSDGYLWSGVPDADLFYIVVGTDDTAIYESTWGNTSDSVQRNGTKASFFCTSTTKPDYS